MDNNPPKTDTERERRRRRRRGVVYID